MIFQTVWKLVLLEWTQTTLTLPSVHYLELQLILSWNILKLKANKLSLNVARTKFMIISSRQKLRTLNDYTIININADGVQVNS